MKNSDGMRLLTVLLLGIAVSVSSSAARERDRERSPKPTTSREIPRAEEPPVVEEPVDQSESRNRRPFVLHGRVVLSDRGVANEPIPIERVCGGVAVIEGVTDLDGRFAIQPWNNPDRLTDASLRRRYPPHELWGCELRASLAGFRSEGVLLGHPDQFGNRELGTIVLHRLDGVTGFSVSRTSLDAPRRARRAYGRGLASARKGRSVDAMTQLQAATRIYPKYSAAWAALGDAQHRAGDLAGARTSYERALEADPEFTRAHIGLTMLAAGAHDWKAIADHTENILTLDPSGYPGALYLNAAANFELGRLQIAEARARRAIELGWSEREPRAILLLEQILERDRDSRVSLR